MSRKINLTAIKKEISAYTKKEKIQLDESYHVHIYPFFAPSKVQEMLTEAIEDHAKAIEAGMKEEMISMLDWILFHLIKHFTDIAIPAELNLKLQAYASLRDSKYFSLMINHFPTESIDQVTLAAKKMIDTLQGLSALGENLENEGHSVVDKENTAATG